MLITDLRRTSRDGLVRASATVTWEDSDRGEDEIYFATEPRFADGLNPNPNAFLLAAFIPAWFHGEHRISIEGALCPELRDGVSTAMKLLGHWYEEYPEPLAVETPLGFRAASPSDVRSAACTMSGGVDSLATLRRNRLNFPLDHELSIRTCFLGYGIDIGGYVSMPGARPHFDRVLEQLSWLGDVSDFELIPVHTNLRHLDDSDTLFAQSWFGAAIASIGHAFSARITTLMIPSGNSIQEQGPQGSHPLLDFNYSSSELRTLHDGFGLSRLEKVGLVADQDEARRILRSCFAPFRGADVLNCGKCEKCLRTMTGLLIHGKLAQCPTFPLDDLAAENLDALRTTLPATILSVEQYLQEMPAVMSSHAVEMWREMIEPLRRMGRDDLAGVIQYKVDSYERQYKSTFMRRALKRCRRAVVTFDKNYLGGNVKRLWRLARLKT